MRRRAPRRKVRWSRVFLLLIILAALLAGIGQAAMYAYRWVAAAPVTVNKTAAPPPVAAAKAPEMLTKRINILLLGVDDGDNEFPNAPKRSDSMLLASINPEDSSIKLVSLPRDTKVTIPGHKGYDKINHAYAYGGAQLAVTTVQDVLQVPIHYYISVDWQAFIRVIDLLGGVDLYVENNMHYEDPYADLVIDLGKGYQHLDGQKAGQYVRFRSDELGDIGRVQRQQRFMKALGDQVLQVGTLIKLPSIVSTMKEYVNTDIGGLTMLKIIGSLKYVKSGSMQAEMLPGKFATINGVSYWVAEPEAVQEMVGRLLVDTPPAK